MTRKDANQREVFSKDIVGGLKEVHPDICLPTLNPLRLFCRALVCAI
jgi:hypothetical protein